MVFVMHQRELATDTHVSPMLNLPPTALPTPSFRVVPEHQLGCPALCIQLALAIDFTCGNVHVSTPSSQVIPPSSSPKSPKVCSLHPCLLCCPVCRIGINHLSQFRIYALTYSIMSSHKQVFFYFKLCTSGVWRTFTVYSSPHGLGRKDFLPRREP